MATHRAEDVPAAAPHSAATQTENERLVIPVIEEEVTIGKQVVETGRVRISKQISQREELVDVPLLREEVTVERVPVNLFVEEQPPVRQEGDTMIIPIVEEQVVVLKKLMLVEELRVRKQIVETHQPQTVTLLKEEISVTRSAENENLNPQTGKR